MAFTSTTLSAAVLASDREIKVASATGFAAGSFVIVGDEKMRVQASYSSGTTIPVLRGVEGTATLAHPTSAQVTVGLSTDLAGAVPGSHIPYPTGVRYREKKTYSATGALTLPTPGTDMLAILNGTTICAMTLAVPTRDMDGDRITVVGNGKAAHTVTVTSGLGNVGATADVITFKADQSQAIELVACGGFWHNLSLVAGAATVAGAGLG